MDNNVDEIAKIVSIAKPLIDPIISAFIKPKIEKLTKWLKKEDVENQVVENFFESKFADYLSITLSKCRSINLLIFQNQQVKIDDIYFPLSISSTKDRGRYKLKAFDKPLFEKIEKILISDTAGMGKSTISKWLCKSVIEENLAIPLLIELRNLTAEHTVLDEIFTQFNPIGQDFDKDLIFKFIELGSFFIVLDGFDEIQLKSQETIIKSIREFVDKANNNWFLLTSRPEGALSAFGDFQNFNIDPLSKDEPFDLIKKYDSIAPTKISKQLIKDIREKYEQVQDLLGNPFLVSLLYSTYTFNKDIPSNKISFYEEIYSALYKRHDLSKDGWTRPKKSTLDIQQFRILLRQLAFDTALLGETNYSETKLQKLVDDALKKSPGLITKPDDFIEDLLTTVPLFQRDGFKIKWAHKSIQDFFASEFIVYDSRKEDFLNVVYQTNTEHFNNVLEFILESDYKSFRKTIVKRLLNDFVNHFERFYKGSEYQAFESVELRRSMTFGITYLFKKADDRNFDEIFNEIDSKHPEYQSDKNRSIFATGYDFEIVAIAGLKIAIIEMLATKSKKYIKTFRFEKELKIALAANTFYDLNDDPKNILNNKRNFNKVSYSLPFPGNRFSDSSFPYIDYIEAKKELDKIEMDIESDSSKFSISNLFAK